MDIGSGNSYPSCALSNFSPHPFVMDGVFCASMEGFLQSLKFSSVEMQEHVCTLVGKAAKFKGKKKKWFRDQTLWWKGVPMQRSSEMYQNVLTKAYDALGENKSFQNALLATQKATLTHSMGRSKINETVLTEREFCNQLYRLRNMLQTKL
ncbi:hypothetical protein fHeYen901_162 [Yersinia phage fHe-Yen9-01]|uniref:Uncharacterized protein n=1 Tax=Yersinia phage fHe-Yen9-01 TaxID=1965363 RepID=A0A1V0DXR2_9CAUD|nr:hypothetical protein KNT60_gp161 [Yersinia phage fHe-Yen9-01]ARB05935.1 hypothetical protein fHeYen901_162 [Yersinia phage fHe-Yen9-01]